MPKAKKPSVSRPKNTKQLNPPPHRAYALAFAASLEGDADQAAALILLEDGISSPTHADGRCGIHDAVAKMVEAEWPAEIEMDSDDGRGEELFRSIDAAYIIGIAVGRRLAGGSFRRAR